MPTNYMKIYVVLYFVTNDKANKFDTTECIIKDSIKENLTIDISCA